MIVLMEKDASRVVRMHDHGETVYFSDCYFEGLGDNRIVFNGGMLYESVRGKLTGHRVLLARTNPYAGTSFQRDDPTPLNLACAVEIQESFIGSGLDRSRFNNERRYDDPFLFYSLFPNPAEGRFMGTLLTHGNLMPQYRSIIEPTDMGPLWRGFLAANGALCESKSFSECIEMNGYRWHDPINTFMSRVAKGYALKRFPNGLFSETDQAIHDLMRIQIYVEQGRYITVSVLTMDGAFVLYSDSLDIRPFLTDNIMELPV